MSQITDMNVKTPEDTINALTGGFYALIAFSWWGFALPIYLRLLEGTLASEILAHRIIWCVPVLLLLVFVMKRWSAVKRVIVSKKMLLLFFLSASLISLNWFVYIYAIETHQLLQASLGYYIGPLVNVMLGVLVLRERLTQLQITALVLAAAGVFYMTFQAAEFPWLALILAFSFSVYGLVRKKVGVAGIEGLFIETCLMLPFGLFYLIWLDINDKLTFLHGNLEFDVLLMLGGFITAMPLIWFAACVKRLKYSTVGFFQFIGPTGQFFVAVLLFAEPFDQDKFIAFLFIWFASLVYLIQSINGLRRRPTHNTP